MVQKYYHLNIEERKLIEAGLKAKRSTREIAKTLDRSERTIHREIERNRIVQQPEYAKLNRVPNNCQHAVHCTVNQLCAECDGPMNRCVGCERCNDVCPDFVNDPCPQRDEAPGCCNGCSVYSKCRRKKFYYRARQAQGLADTRLRESRTGLSMDEDTLLRIGEIVKTGLKRGQSLHAIHTANNGEMFCSQRTLYSLVSQGRFGSCLTDMPLKLRRKPRKKTKEHKVDRACRIGRRYDEFLDWQKSNGGVKEVQMDTVIGKSGIHKTFLTLYWTNANFLMLFLLERNTSAEVCRIFKHLHELLGKARFQKLFPVILTDGGSEFSNPKAIEGPNGQTWTKLFYCDPQQSQQKGAIEQEHSMIRRVVPKGTCFDHLGDEDASLLASHITSYLRPGLGGRAPQEVFHFLYREDPTRWFGLEYIEPNEVLLTPELLPKAEPKTVDEESPIENR